MLRQLDPVQIAEHWNEIKEHMRVGLLPFVAVDEEHLTTLLESMLAGVMNVWILFTKEPLKMYGMATTTFIWDPVTLTKNLVLFSISSYSTITPDLWNEVKKVLSDYAKENKCNNVIAYSSVPDVIRLAQLEGADISTHLLQWRIDK